MQANRKTSRVPARKPAVERYQEIIRAAEFLVAESQSLETLTLQAVAERANIPRVSLYYFFDSIDALIETLYKRGMEKMMASISDVPESAEWRDLMEAAMDKARAFFLRNHVEMVLVFSPKSLPMLVQVNELIGKDLHALLITRADVSSSVNVQRACEIAAEIADTIWRKSFIEKGKITSLYHKQAKLAVLSYLAAVIETQSR